MFPRHPILTTELVSWSLGSLVADAEAVLVRKASIREGVWLTYSIFTLVRRALDSASWYSAAAKAPKLNSATA
jgi:hypothetical protein